MCVKDGAGRNLHPHSLPKIHPSGLPPHWSVDYPIMS